MTNEILLDAIADDFTGATDRANILLRDERLRLLTEEQVAELRGRYPS